MKFFILLAFCVTASAEVSRLPEEFYVTERYLSLASTFDVASDVEWMGAASKRIVAWTPTFDLANQRKEPLATATARFFVWGTVADIVDPEGKEIGCIEEELWRILPWAEYRVFDATKRIIAIAKMDFWGTEFDLHDPLDSSRIFAKISRPWVHLFRDSWSVKILDRSVFDSMQFDPRLLVFLAILQTDKDNRDRFRREIENQLRFEFEQFEGTSLYKPY